MTPIQPAAATLLQAAQLQQLISAGVGAGAGVGSPLSATGGGFGSGNGNALYEAYGSSRPSTSSSSNAGFGVGVGVGNASAGLAPGPISATLPLTASLQASILQQHQRDQQRRTSFGEGNATVVSAGKDGRGSGLSSASSLNANAPGVIGTSPRLARLSNPQMQSQNGEQIVQQPERNVSGPNAASSSSDSASSLPGSSAPPQQPNAKTPSTSLTVSPTSSSPLRQTHTSSGSSSAELSRASGQSQTLEAPKSRRPSTASMSTSPRAQHPAHPGTIALPPPPPPNAFPYTPHPYQYAMGGPISPLGHPGSPLLYSAYVQVQSPGHPYPPPHPHPGAMQTPPTYAQVAGYGGVQNQSQSQSQSQDVAHGHGHGQAQGQGAQMATPYGLPPITPSMPSFSFVPQPSPAGMMSGSSAIPPTPAESGMGQEQSHSWAGGAAYQHSGLSHAASVQNQNAATPMSYPYNAVMGMASPPIHFPPHMFSPFTPGTALSPGAFWGHPGHGGHVAPHLNPAVGSRPLHHAYGPGSQPTSPAAGGFFPVMEPSGYFPPVLPPQGRQEYFPPVPASVPAQSSGLANEVTYQEGDVERESGSAVLVDGVDGADHAGERERTRSSSSSFSAQSSAQGEGDESGGGGRASSVATSWRSSDERVPTKAGLANLDTASTGTLKSLAGEMASMRLGEPPKGRKSQGARRVSEKDDIWSPTAPVGPAGRRESVAVDDEEHAAGAVAPGQQPNRSHSMGEASSSRPQTLQKTHSDETGERLVLDARTTKSAGAVQKLVS